ncbi:hypothetical protein [Microcystis phage Mae-JY09]
MSDDQRQKAIDLITTAILRQFFPFGGADRDLLARLVEPIVDHHVECAERIRAVGR